MIKLLISNKKAQGVCFMIFEIFWIFFASGITVPRLIIVGYVKQIVGTGVFLAHHPYAAQ